MSVAGAPEATGPGNSLQQPVQSRDLGDQKGEHGLEDFVVLSPLKPPYVHTIHLPPSGQILPWRREEGEEI